MHFVPAAATLLTMASTAIAATASVKNQCNQVLYVTVTNSSLASTQYPIAANGTYSQPIVGLGNQFGITKDPNYYTTTTPKFIFGFSDATSAKLNYWSISSVDGSPFDTFLVSTSDPTCTNASTYDGQVHTCEDSAGLVVTLC